MAFCINCGQELADGAKFCASCGKAVNNDSTNQRKTVYDGEIHKCPNCGDILDAYEFVCETCGYERRGAKSANSVSELQKRLSDLYAKRPPKKIKTVFEHAISGGQLTNIDEEIVNLIKSFVIPNNKEDILEFAILAASCIDVKVYGSVDGERYNMLNPAQREISDAWLTKLEQAYEKAKIMFENSQAFESIKRLLKDKRKEIKKKKWQLPITFIGSILGVVLIMTIFVLIIKVAG